MDLIWKAFVASTVLLVAGCATYTTPGRGVPVELLSSSESPAPSADKPAPLSENEIEQSLTAQPAASFPARIAFVRLQAAGYRDCYGSGRFCVVTHREIESEENYARLGKMPQVAGLAVMNRLVLPPSLTSTRDLRRTAAVLRADMLLVYSLDTTFRVENTDVGPLQLLSLGFLPTKKAQVTATASAVMFDVRTGFIYGLAEGTAFEEQRGTLWSSSDAVDNARKRAEAEAFGKLVGEIEKFWRDVVKTHAGGRAAAPAG